MIFFLVKDLDLILHTWIQHGPWWTCRAWKSPFLGFLLSFSFFFPPSLNMTIWDWLLTCGNFWMNSLFQFKEKCSCKSIRRFHAKGAYFPDLTYCFGLIQQPSSWRNHGARLGYVPCEIFFFCVYINLLYLHCNCRISFLVYLHFRVSIQQQNSTVQQELSVDVRYM